MSTFSSALLRTACVLLAFTVISCTSSVSTNIATYRSGDLPSKGIVRVLPAEVMDGSKAFDPLEFDFFARELKQQLKQRGYKVLDGDEGASDLDLELSYSVARQQKETRSNGNVRFNTVLGYPYGFYGSGLWLNDGGTDIRFEYVREIKLMLLESGHKDDATPLLSLTGRSEGSCANLQSVFPPMVSALLQNLNQPDGSVLTVKVPSEKRCY